MDAQFYEFWSRWFQAAAEGRRGMEALSTWIRQGFQGTEEMNALLARFYPGASSSAERRDATVDRFRESFREMARVWGFVTREEHQESVDARRDLERKVAEQQETIERLRRLLDEAGGGQADLFQRFQDLMMEQGDQFQQLMEGFGSAVGGRGKADSEDENNR